MSNNIPLAWYLVHVPRFWEIVWQSWVSFDLFKKVLGGQSLVLGYVENLDIVAFDAVGVVEK